ncbi:MAG TPA: hypothetical protein ACFE0H_04550 [Elainellaceae cyanobacterium]
MSSDLVRLIMEAARSPQPDNRQISAEGTHGQGVDQGKAVAIAPAAQC